MDAEFGSDINELLIVELYLPLIDWALTAAGCRRLFFVRPVRVAGGPSALSV